jgi:hypothetical protein
MSRVEAIFVCRFRLRLDEGLKEWMWGTPSIPVAEFLRRSEWKAEQGQQARPLHPTIQRSLSEETALYRYPLGQ